MTRIAGLLLRSRVVCLHIDSDNIVDAFRQLELRGIKVDRCSNYDDFRRLNFVDERKGTASRFRSGEFATSVNEIPNFEKFFSQAARYLRQVKFVIRDEVVAGGKAEPLLIDTSVIEMKRFGPARCNFTLSERSTSIPEFRFEVISRAPVILPHLNGQTNLYKVSTCDDR